MTQAWLLQRLEESEHRLRVRVDDLRRRLGLAEKALLAVRELVKRAKEKRDV